MTTFDEGERDERIDAVAQSAEPWHSGRMHIWYVKGATRRGSEPAAPEFFYIQAKTEEEARVALGDLTRLVATLTIDHIIRLWPSEHEEVLRRGGAWIKRFTQFEQF